MSTIHKNLTGADLHEPKGADTASAGKVYVSDGAGSGTWVLASSLLTAQTFTAGDLKFTHKLTADSGWLLWGLGTIGDGSSGATLRADSDTAILYGLYWNNYSNADCPVTTGRGITADADFAAHKSIALPLGVGRAIGLAGTGDISTNASLSRLGSATHNITLNELPTGITSTNTASITLSVTSTTARTLTGTIQSANVTGGADRALTSNGVNEAIVSAGTIAISGIASISNNTGGAAMSLWSPTVFVNIMIKL